MNLALSIGGIYFFILLGFATKRIGKNRIDEKSLVYISLFALQPILTFWGIAGRNIADGTFLVPFIFTLTILILLLILWLPVRLMPIERRERSIVLVGTVIDNTGNLGIPLGMALFGNASIIYTSLINLANVFLVFTIGVYLYSRGNFSVKESIVNIARLPAMWFGIGALLFNAFHFQIPKALEQPLQMGAYAAIVLQLIIFGAYLATIKVSTVPWKLLGIVTSLKFILTPLLTLFILHIFQFSPMVHDIFLLELIVPMAVMNVNLAALYNCHPDRVAFLTFATSIIFLPYLFISAKILFISL